ncbi:DUF342 domain-containing protein [Paenibacillus thalictri]|uniref:DUF342 domain-containing protein n=1 Tax=Paenibacillus thalictri TaxID=2527873 RepID=A0A4Q9DNT8_9BACL|nr:FapA family protein [Paenibacillus thalictri]TBL77754.1 DUF342 domain-containing protein [Paenibacillus thalictri]
MSDSVLPLHYYITVSTSDDKLASYITFNHPDEDIQFSLEELEELLRSNRIIYGIDYGKLAQIAHEPKAYYLMEVEVAKGDRPIDGKNGEIKYFYDLNNDKKTPLELDDGKVDYKEVTTINNVRKGQLIAQRIQPTDGIQGRAVTGEVLFPKAGKEARFKIGKNVVMDAEQMHLYAAIDGVVTKTERDKMNVFPIYEVNGDLDYKIGNIDFVGNVVIRGNILPGFKIKSGGDIRVSGGVEGADLEAGGSIEISAGILGQNKAVVKAGKDVKSSFIQDATVEAGEQIIVSQSIMHSQIRAGKNVICKGTKGLIVGGVVQAGERVVTRTVGNSMSTVTVIEVGVLPELRNELQQLRLQLKAIGESLDKTEKALSLLDQLAAVGQLGPDKVSMRIKLNHTKKQALEEQAAGRERILEIEKTLEDTDAARVEINSTIYGGAKVVIGRYTKFVKDPARHIVYKLSDGDIIASPMV